MSQKLVGRTGAALAIIGLSLSLTACGGQSTADACKIADKAVNNVATDANSKVTEALTKMTSGEDVDFGEIFDPVVKALHSAEDDVSNEDVKKPLTAFTKEYEGFVEMLKDVDLSGYAEITKKQEELSASQSDVDLSDAKAVKEYNDKLKALQDEAAELQDDATQIQDDVTSKTKTLTKSAKDLQEVCNK